MRKQNLLFLFVMSSLISSTFTGKSSVSCPSKCLSYNDGCNLCDCTNSNSPVCTSRSCRTSTTSPYCAKCDSNFKWNECGSSCVKTCDNPTPICISECIKKCECPEDKPIYNNGVCIKYDDCVSQKPKSTCPSDCSVYFNGCNFCECNSDGSMSCTSNTCSTTSEPYCATCKNNLEWTTCGSSCTKTCSTTNITCSNTACTAKCSCPSHKPIYHNGVCIAANECFNFQNVCPKDCTDYYDGCNNCTCLDGQDACTNNNCLVKGESMCTNCTHGRVWNSCGTGIAKTCSEPTSNSASHSCVAQCECPSDKPIWKNSTCIAYSECNCQCGSVPLPNGKYVASRTSKCNVFQTESDCKSLKICAWKCQ